MRICFSLDQLPEIGIAQRHCDCRLFAIWSRAFACFAGVFEIDVPGFLGAGLVLEGEGEDGTARFDGVGAFGGGGEGGVYGIEGGGRREVGCEAMSVNVGKGGMGRGEGYGLRWTWCRCRGESGGKIR